ncbi:UDP-N-acetylmuramoyl-tripeptide--D-alanyl-D-alanine ligase [Zhouia spongiae]|uniref:UDP-N-acetylmuramoyl-tripeptide--D-alanyl-D-alanine ligase n=1 Tax=Zhouia spongiae TaxID=2202721 RepID=A0ABY3YRA8_9FLAO|nr:UDP-N-acetylmuramoyl-tripeptide--D-alanyl-D-alanine ligase [Zhouia spongiae]UNZ00295.1 UDP-N-acetylmuramoyl-tripeptide--D-alanyl-D-alanine ligase [Zhouia spongiae]
MKTEDLYNVFLNCNKVCTDTRKIEEGDLFFALKGDHFDGNAYAEEALKKGAGYAVIDNPQYSVKNTILVGNVLHTLQQLANYHRKQLTIPVVALTGSNGKTTTKELFNAVLSQKYNTTATIGNLNNHIGVPLTLLSMNKDTELGIVEMGANHLEEIGFLCNIAEPDYGYITNFGKAHLEGFGGMEGVIKGKSELYNYLISGNKTIFYNANDSKQSDLLKSYQNTYSFGDTSNCDVIISLTSHNPFVSVDFEKLQIQTNLIGKYNFPNIAAAITIGTYFKIAPEAIQKALASYTPSNNRSQIIRKGNNKVVLDAYNANPSSMSLALESFSQMDDKNKIAILGDMFELGHESATEHQHIAELALKKKLQGLYLVGNNFFSTNSSSKKFKTFEDLKEYLMANKPENSSILIKGSRGMALERILEFL